VRHYTSLFSSLGTPAIATGLVLPALLLVLLRTDRRTAWGLVVACLVIPLNALLKLLSGPTPLWSATHHTGHNFPSGHVAFVTSVVGYLGWVAFRRQQPAVAALALLVVLGMGPARVLVGAHLVSDVIAGYLVGAAVLVLALAAGRIETPSVQRSSPLTQGRTL
jgi:undecaprenyl-diphosphatase